LLREKLAGISAASVLTVESKYVSRTEHGDIWCKPREMVETVFIPTENRDTICFRRSPDVLKCDFCLTAKLQFR
jgi:adenine C2-methylase RlmN of 23S rRNA A2503 and tRNA A37